MNLSLSNKVTWLLVAVLVLSRLTVEAYAVCGQGSLAQNLMRDWGNQCTSRHLERLGQGLADSELDRVVETINRLADELSGLIHKDDALALCRDQACHPHNTMSAEEDHSERSDAVDFIREHIEGSGGRFWIESEQGMDLVFHVTLPDERIEAYQEETEGARQ